jgi:hypothetical protein
MIHMVAEHQHYLDHMTNIWDALPDHVKGKTFLKEDRVVIPSGDHVLVAGYSDVKRIVNPTIYVEHGAGQHYVGLDLAVQPFYSGGPQHRSVVGYICPNEEVAGRWRTRYPNKATAVVGCPRLDPWHAGLRDQCDPRTLAVTFHWDAQFTGAPETASAFPHYLVHLPKAIVRWRNEGWHVLGHAHPRYPALAAFWQSPEIRDLGVEFVESSDGVLDRAAVLIADNTSLQAEFLSLGRPVVWLNHPSYRRDVWQGGRFWQWPTLGGLQVDSGAELLAVDLTQLPPVTGHPYAYADGRASQRAADAIMEILSTEDH